MAPTVGSRRPERLRPRPHHCRRCIEGVSLRMLRYCRRRCGQVRLGALRRIRSMRPERLKRSHGALRVCRFRYPPTPHAACPSTLLLKGGGHGSCICVAGARWRDVAVLRRWAAVVAASTACDAELGLFPAGSAQPPLAPHRRALRTPRSWQGKYMIPETPSWQGSQRAPRRTPSRGCGLEQLEGEFKLQEPRGPGGVRLNAESSPMDSERTCHWRGS